MNFFSFFTVALDSIIHQMQKRPEPLISQRSRPHRFNVLLFISLTCSLTHLQIWRKRRSVDSAKPTTRHLNSCDIYFLRFAVFHITSVLNTPQATHKMALSRFKSATLRKNRVCHQWKNKKNFRAEKARKALMTLRLTQCHQNWLTNLAGSANFEDAIKTRIKAQP